MTAGRRAGRFALVGLLGFGLQLALLRLLVDYGHLHYLVATGLAVEGTILHNFIWHSKWTWRDRPGAALPWWMSLVRFNGLTAIASIAGNVGLMALFVEAARLPLLPANAMAVAVMSAANFIGADRLVFPARSRASLVAGAALVLVMAPGSAPAAELTKETKAAWRQQVAATESRIDRELQSPARFLALDFDGAKAAAEARAALRGGAVTVRNLAGSDHGGEGTQVPSGTIHHWRGAVFIPDVSVEQVLAAVTDPGAGTPHRQEDVLEARVLSRSPNHLRLFLKLQRRAIVTATYNTVHEVEYRAHGPGRASSRSVATRIAEVVNAGEEDEHERPPGVDRGFLWGLNSYWRYQAVSGGVIVELESLTLSRGVPWGVGAVVRPVVDQVARESLTRTLVSLRARFASSARE
jgi:putative flippase GtrA